MTRQITLDLLRKRSEHNEGLVSSLEELALHQEDLQCIGPILGRTCGKTLRILLLQNNVIERMDPSHLKLFRSLEYVNLALNNISKIQMPRGGLEWLRKLDLTLNFIGLDSLEESIDNLAPCRSLEELFLLGNPCMGIEGKGDKKAGWTGCRAYIIARLPTLKSLDGTEIKRSERLIAVRQLPALTSELHSLAEECRRKDLEKRDDTSRASHVADEEATHHNPESRTKLSNETFDRKRAKEKQASANLPPEPKTERESEREHRETVQRTRERGGRELEEASGSTAQQNDGKIKQCNQGKYKFWFEEESEDDRGKRRSLLVMRVQVPRYLSISLIDADVHPTFVSVVIKSKILRVVLPVEVLSDQSIARRNTSTGYLELVMPKADPDDVLVGLGHVRDSSVKATPKRVGTAASGSVYGDAQQATRKGLGHSLLAAADANPLKIVQRETEEEAGTSHGDDEPPPLF
mmetsp:Transcript_30489/g.72531  ORF Transcript_30489/g.72531 Transcript_30489/m.72531 type:complete len:464 (-) Transcript_30489:70-1461(-)